MKDFEIILEAAPVLGNRLTLKVNNGQRYIQWAVEDSFNGQTRFSDIKKPIYGFFKPKSTVTLILIHELKPTESVRINNVMISERQIKDNRRSVR